MYLVMDRFSREMPVLTGGAVATILGGIMAAEHPAMSDLRARVETKATMLPGNIAVIPMKGVLAYDPHPVEMAFFGYEDSRTLLKLVTQATNSPEVAGVLLAIDSPGGFLTGGGDVAEAVRRLQTTKPTVAHIGGMGASMAYWIASQAGAVLASSSAQVGSIGVFSVSVDQTAAYRAAGIEVSVIRNTGGDLKAAGAYGTTMTEAQRVNVQEGVDAAFGQFKSAVKATRGDVPDAVMRGQIFTGRQAKTNGLIDAVGSQDYAISALRKMLRNQ